MHEVILKCMDGLVIDAMYNEFGNHVIQRIIELADLKKVNKIILT